MTTNISSVANWNTYVGNNTAQNYSLQSDLTFDASFTGNLNLQPGRIFEGNNKRIYLNNISNFNGLFNLHSGNLNSTVQNLTVICSNLSVGNDKGIVVNGSSDASIQGNGSLTNLSVVFRSGTLGTRSGGLVGRWAGNMTLNNCYFDAGTRGSINTANGGGLFGSHAGVGGNININNCWVKGILDNNTGGLIGNDSVVNSVFGSYMIGTANNNNGVTLGNTTITSRTNVVDSGSASTSITAPSTSVDYTNINTNINLLSGKVYQINNTNVLSNTTLGSGVVNSSLTSVGTLTGLTVSGQESITNTTQSTSTTTGALVVSGGVGIASNLNIGGNLNFNGSLLQNGSPYIGSQWTTSGSNIYYTTGSVGIGNASPLAMLHITPSSNRSALQIDQSSSYPLLNPNAVYINKWSGDGMATIDHGSGSTGGFLFRNNAGATTLMSIIGTSGNVGIGSNSPTTTLDVAGTAKITGVTQITNTTQSTSSTTGALIVSGGVGIASNLNVGGNTNLSSGQAYFINNTNVLNSTTLGSGIVNSSLTSVGTLTGLTVSGQESITNTTQSTSTSTGALIVSGGVGIASNVNIGGNLNVTNIERITNTTQSTSSTTGALVVSGGVGIASNLNVGGNVRFTNPFVIESANPSYIASFNNSTSSGSNGVRIRLDTNNVGSASFGLTSSDIFFATGWDGSNNIERMRINSSGKVGIGTSGPNTALHVNSSTTTYITIQAPFANQTGIEFIDTVQRWAIYRPENDNSLRFWDGGRDIMTLLHNEGVGIRTNSPLAAFDINLSKSASGGFSGSHYYITSTTSTTGTYTSGVNVNLSLRTSNDYHCGGVIRVFSDRRIKSNIELIDDNLALNKLRLIEPKKYQYIDKVQRGSVEVFGFIAQEVMNNIPEAVKMSTEFIPDIYQLNQYTDISGNVIQLNNIVANVQIGDKLKLIDQTDYITGNIQSIDSNTITVELEKPITLTGNAQLDGNVFVYGKQVNDFHTLDKNYLFTINFAATQELDRQLQWHTKGIDNSVSGNAEGVYGQSLYLENQQLKQQINDILQRLANANI